MLFLRIRKGFGSGIESRTELKRVRQIDNESGNESPHSTLQLIHNSAVMLGAAEAVHGVEAGQDELDAACAHRRVAGRVDLEGLVPDGRHTFEPIGITSRR